MTTAARRRLMRDFKRLQVKVTITKTKLELNATQSFVPVLTFDRIFNIFREKVFALFTNITNMNVY